jgi:hypothetical protein
MQVDTESTETDQANPLFSCYICNGLDHNSGNCGSAGTIFDECLGKLVHRQMKKGDPKAPKVTYIEWTKPEHLNDFNEQGETVEEYYLRCIDKAKQGHVLDADFVIQLARLSTRLGLMNPETWKAFSSEFYGEDNYPKGGDTPEVRAMLGAQLNKFMTNAWSKGTVGSLGTHLYNHMVERNKPAFQAMARYCIETFGRPKGTYITTTGIIAFSGKFPLCDFPYPKDGRSWDVTLTRSLMIRLMSSHKVGTGHYSIHHKVTMAYAGAFILARGLPSMAKWRLSVHRQKDGLYTLRIDLGYTVLEPVLCAYLATPKNADGSHNAYGLHSSVVSYANLTEGLAYFLYHHSRINDYLEAQLLGGLTRSGLVTLRFGRIDLTGTDGCPLAFHDADWCYAIKRVTQGLDVIYDQLTATNPGKAHAAASTKASDQGPRTHLSTQHLMLHLHQDKICGSTDEEVDMISDVS